MTVRWASVLINPEVYDRTHEQWEVDYQQRYGDELLQLARDERSAWEEMRSLLDQAAAIAVEWGMERGGDGHGGAVIADWVVALEGCLGYELIDPPILTPSRPKGRKPISARKRVRVFARDGFQCATCADADPESLSIDHIVPVSKGGGDEEENLRTLCTSCNSRKGTKDA